MQTTPLVRLLAAVAFLFALLMFFSDDRPTILSGWVMAGIGVAGIAWLIIDEIVRRKKGK